MEARMIRPIALGLAAGLFCLSTFAQAQVLTAKPRGLLGRQQSAAARSGMGQGQNFAAQSQNFVVFASSAEWAKQVSDAAEQYRRDLAIYWLGEELPPWNQRCPIHVQSAENLGAGGETRFSLMSGTAGNWMMSVQGTQERILDSVLPHEITHTIFASHFAPLNKYVPRWADEGACTTVEHEAEKSKHRHYLVQFLQTGRGLAFNNMFNLKDYPQDILPLYAQGHSAVQFLLDQGGPRVFVQFLDEGMTTDAWTQALQHHYQYGNIGEFQTSWNLWLADGSPKDMLAYSPKLRANATSGAAESIQLVSNESDVPAATQLASNATPAGWNPQSFAADARTGQQANADHFAQNDSATSDQNWYKRRLQEVSGAPATTVVPHNHFEGHSAGSPYRSSPSFAASSPNPQTPVPNAYDGRSGTNGDHPAGNQTVGHPQPMQGPGIQVLEWGDSVPLGHVIPTRNAAAQQPLYR